MVPAISCWSIDIYFLPGSFLFRCWVQKYSFLLCINATILIKENRYLQNLKDTLYDVPEMKCWEVIYDKEVESYIEKHCHFKAWWDILLCAKNVIYLPIAAEI